MYVGRHRICVVLAGQVVTHQQWSATHDGACVPGCQPYKVLTHAKPPKRKRPSVKRRPVAQQVQGWPLKPLDFGGDPYA